MHKRSVGLTLAFVALLGSLLTLAYGLYAENEYLRAAYLVNLWRFSKHFVNMALIIVLVLLVVGVVPLWMDGLACIVLIAAVAVGTLGIQIGVFFYARKAFPGSVESYRKAWTEERVYSEIVQRILLCCGFDSVDQSRGKCRWKKTCQKKIIQEMEGRKRTLMACTSVSLCFHLCTAVAIALIRQSGPAAKGYRKVMDMDEAP